MREEEPMNRFVIISGCSGGGKSTLLLELARRGYATVEEPGRRIIREENRIGGSALPWTDMAAFARRAMEVAIEDRGSAAHASSWVFFDRGLVDAAAALEHATGEPALRSLERTHRYNTLVFFTPPWPEIYTGDDDRRHDMAAAFAEYNRLLHVYPNLGYDVDLLPITSVEERADYLLKRLESLQPSAER